jgi:hypothetical protein
MTRSRTALLAGVGIAVLYLAGAALSGRASLLARRPLLDGLAPPVPYRWVTPPPSLAADNKRPASLRFEVELGANGSRLGAFATSDGQLNLVLGEGAVPARQGQTAAAFTVQPVDPATIGPVPGLLVAGNAYRIQATYRPSGEGVDTLGNQTSVGLIYPLLAAPVADPSGHLVVASADGRGWQRLRSTDTPGTHQVSAEVGTTGYVAAAIPPAGAEGGSQGGRGRVLLLASVVALLLVLAALLARRRLAAAGPGGRRGRPTRTSPPRPGQGSRPGPSPKPSGRNPARRRRRR